MKHLIAATLIATLIASAHAAPYAVRVSGFTAPATTLQGVHPGQGYSVTFILDNGGTSGAGQVWQAQHLACVIWRFNNAQDAVYRHDLAGASPDVTGQVASNAAGTDNGAPPNAANLPTLTIPAVWTVEAGATEILTSGNGQSVIATTGVYTIPGYWTPPRRVAAACDDTDYVAAPTPVPALGPLGRAHHRRAARPVGRGRVHAAAGLDLPAPATPPAP